MIHPSASSRSFNQVSIDSSALYENFRILQQRVGRDMRIMAMVKADAYGHGMVQAALNFAKAGCDCFGVAEISEGVTLRRAGIQGQIFVLLGFQPSQEQLFFDYDLTPVVFDSQALKLLSQAAMRNGKELAVHLKVDCGMGRLGIMPSEVQDFLAQIEVSPGLSLAGIMSHFPMADTPASRHTLEMYQRYKEICTQSLTHPPVLCHIANSGAALYFPETRCDMVRLGISLYGYYPDGAEGRQHEGAETLVPAMSFTTRVVQVKSVPPGTGISYGHSHITAQETRIAVLPVGYGDGFLRTLSNKAQVLIKGQRARIIGRVCMNLCMADISEIQGVETGDQVVILGSQGAETITADEIAEWMGTISYEVLCLFGNNNERNYN
ncbi:MAG: alanine racemase [Desulfobulbaceae bacterium]